MATFGPRNIVIDAKASIGEKTPLLTEIKPVYEYKGAVRTDKIIGYKYVVALPSHRLEQLEVKILGEKLLDDIEEDDYREVRFSGLSMGLYRSGETYKVYCNATGVELVNETSG